MYLFDLHVLCICLASPIPSTWSPLLQKHYEQRNFKTVISIYNLTIYPNQLLIFEQGAAGVPPGLFNENATGRVDPVGNFTGFEDSIEYFFALAPVPQANSASAAIASIQITEFSSACPEVAASVVHLFCSVVNPSSSDNGTPLAPLKQAAFWKFDEHGAVLKYDAWIPNLNNWIEASLGISISNPQIEMQTIQQLCAVTQQRRTGSNTQWISIEECVSTLSQKPYGNYDEAWGDNIVCQAIHLVLTQVWLQVHCPQIGPIGGGKCVDFAYPLEYFNDQALYDDPLRRSYAIDYAVGSTTPLPQILCCIHSPSQGPKSEMGKKDTKQKAVDVHSEVDSSNIVKGIGMGWFQAIFPWLL